jgi:hypothetical protein
MTQHGKQRMRSFPHLSLLFLVVFAPLVLASCGGASSLPPPRSLILFTGVRVQADADRMEEVDRWLQPQLEEVRRARGFVIRTLRVERPEYPWQSMEVGRDTARIFVQQVAPDTETPFAIYAHFHMMALRGDLARWLPEAADAEGFELERAILKRIADLWLYGRAVYSVPPYGPLDELLYASEYGFLDEFILAAQADDRFSELRVSRADQEPERWEAFEQWFQDTFERDGPGFMYSESSPVEGDEEGPRRRRTG